MIKCQHCTKGFEPVNLRQKFCSKSCKTLAYLNRKDEAVEKETDDKPQKEIKITLSPSEISILKHQASMCKVSLEEFVKTKSLLDGNIVAGYEGQIERLQNRITEKNEELKKLKVKLTMFCNESSEHDVLIELAEEEYEMINQCFIYLRSEYLLPLDITFKDSFLRCLISYLREGRYWHHPKDVQKEIMAERGKSISKYAGVDENLKQYFTCLDL